MTEMPPLLAEHTEHHIRDSCENGVPDDSGDTLVADPGIDVTDTDLTLHRRVAELPEPQRTAVAAWLVAHDVDPDRVAVGAPVTRHEESSSLSWREPGADGEGLLVHHVFPAVQPSDVWPAPFPLAQVAPQA